MLCEDPRSIARLDLNRQPRHPGDVLISDNLASHKTRAVRSGLREAGYAVRYLPPYSPDRNPIEQAFSKRKRTARTAAERTIDGVKKLGPVDDCA